jgi:recombination DNA repair RAD52 pathway protein
MPLTFTQYETLSRPINPTRVAKRTQGGKQLSYLESWDVRAHLVRIFGYGNFDVELLGQGLVFEGEYENVNEKTGEVKEMVEVAYRATVRLTVRDTEGFTLCTYTEGSVGSATGPRKYGMRGDLHDNALKSAESDALKRCAINLGNQFGMSLYDSGATRDVVRGTLVKPDNPDAYVVTTADGTVVSEAGGSDLTDAQAETLRASLGAEIVSEAPAEQPEGVGSEDADAMASAPGEGPSSPVSEEVPA